MPRRLRPRAGRRPAHAARELVEGHPGARPAGRSEDASRDRDAGKPGHRERLPGLVIPRSRGRRSRRRDGLADIRRRRKLPPTAVFAPASPRDVRMLCRSWRGRKRDAARAGFPDQRDGRRQGRLRHDRRGARGRSLVQPGPRVTSRVLVHATTRIPCSHTGRADLALHRRGSSRRAPVRQRCRAGRRRAPARRRRRRHCPGARSVREHGGDPRCSRLHVRRRRQGDRLPDRHRRPAAREPCPGGGLRRVTARVDPRRGLAHSSFREPGSRSRPSRSCRRDEPRRVERGDHVARRATPTQRRRPARGAHAARQGSDRHRRDPDDLRLARLRRPRAGEARSRSSSACSTRARRSSARRTCSSSPGACWERTSGTAPCTTRRGPDGRQAARRAATPRRSRPVSATSGSAPTPAARSGSRPPRASSSA